MGTDSWKQYRHALIMQSFQMLPFIFVHGLRDIEMDLLVGNDRTLQTTPELHRWFLNRVEQSSQPS